MKKKILTLLLASVMAVSVMACGGKEETTTEEPKEESTVDIQEMIEIFGDDGDGNITQEEGSFPYFISNREKFRLLNESEIGEKIVGTWTIRDKFGDEFEHTFNADGTAKTTYQNTESECHWLVEGGFFYFGFNTREIDTSRYLNLEVREVEEGILALYGEGTINSDGTEEMDSPYAVLVKQ